MQVCVPSALSCAFAPRDDVWDPLMPWPCAGTALASAFSQHLNEAGLRTPLPHRSPTPMLSPTAAIAAQMDALQINDWPDTDAGIRTAFLFSKPYGCETMVAGRVRKWIFVRVPSHARPCMSCSGCACHAMLSPNLSMRWTLHPIIHCYRQLQRNATAGKGASHGCRLTSFRLRCTRPLWMSSWAATAGR